MTGRLFVEVDMVDSDYYRDCAAREPSELQLLAMRLYREGKLPSCKRKKRKQTKKNGVY